MSETEELKQRIAALEAFLLDIGQVLYNTLPPYQQEQMQEIRELWNKCKKLESCGRKPGMRRGRVSDECSRI